jgi:hypothetical protein
MDATFTPNRQMTFAQRFAYERAMLALEDPDGEYEAIGGPVDVERLFNLAENPISDEEGYRATQHKALRDAAFAGDWSLFDRIKNEMADESWMTRAKTYQREIIPVQPQTSAQLALSAMMVDAARVGDWSRWEELRRDRWG